MKLPFFPRPLSSSRIDGSSVDLMSVSYGSLVREGGVIGPGMSDLRS